MKTNWPIANCFLNNNKTAEDSIMYRKLFVELTISDNITRKLELQRQVLSSKNFKEEL